MSSDLLLLWIDNKLYFPENFRPTREQPRDRSARPASSELRPWSRHFRQLWLTHPGSLASGNRWEIRTTKPCVLLNPGALLWHHKSWSRSLLWPRAGTGSRQKGGPAPAEEWLPAPGLRRAWQWSLIKPRQRRRGAGVLEAPDRMKCLRHHNLPLCALIVPTRQWGNWGKAEANDLPRSEPLPPNQHPPGRCPSYIVAVVSLLCLKSGVTFWWEETSWRQQSGFRPPLPQILFGMAFLSFVSPDLHSIRYFSLNWRALDVHHAAPRWPYNDRPPLLAPGARTLLPISCRPSWD